MKKIKISIVVVTYNAACFVEKTITSIINQVYSDYELLLIDGGSMDRTVEIVREKCVKTTDLIILSEPDNGIYDAMNKGARLSTGDFIIFLNAGDYFYNDEVLLNVVGKILNLNTIYYGDALGFNESNYTIPYRVGQFTKYRLAHENICHQTVFYPRSCFFMNHFDIQYQILADWEFNIRMFKKYSFCHLELIIVLYDLAGISAITPDFVFERKQKSMILKYLGLDTVLFLFFRKFVKYIKC